MMWETKQIDNIQRMNDLLTLGSNINYRSVLPLQKANEDVVQSLCRDVYIDPDDNPDYDPPDSNVSGKMMRQMIHSKCENKRSFVPTDLETRKDELEKLAKDFEPYDHLTPEELSDVFLKNTKKEYELAVATYKRRIRNRSVEDYEEKRELEAGIRDLEVEEVAKRKRPDGNMVSDVYNKTRGECLTELLYFISLLEHLQWHFFASVNLPMESLVDVKEIGYSPTNPRVPGIKFGDPLCAEGSIHSKYFLSERGGASIVRKCLTVGGLHNTKADAKQGNQLLLFGDDPLFFVKDQEMLQHMLQCGIGLEIHSKVPGFVLPSEPTEFQKDTSYYRLSTTQPQCLIICSNCGYNIFSHSIKTHDGEKLDGREYDILASNDDAKCPSCNGSVNINHEYWITGSRGYCYEPYPTPIADEL
uniref:Uncharacterized protein n=2 Tax=Babesia bovis TaxID=5865 RepID=A7ARH3_BABBO|eukprot:XP_001610710.1 hypothetical protein [Babesia bovis T2Bo]